ncbi:hypothetical protein JQN72_02025 [Phycicoccus sp. CSK15P-2]|uniref:HAAS signaling domain-containing protein n=1 Tax=Phycicoccus sp. CSK15P-2 TaxID=2807627 RepID=UPI0019519AE4|nr:hypothetical protein [Phycicoccus sp. CSK15P-2]MBM6403026.1 hypothetical protein [Phycicoccus sp. CSK15P-2]
MTTAHARVESYLGELDRMLAGLDPATRDDVLAGIREHLDATLAEHPEDPRALNDALLRLGPPEHVAADARSGGAPPPSRRWGPGAVAWASVGVLATGVATAPFLVLESMTYLIGIFGDRVADELYLGGLSILASASWATPIWLAGLVAVVVSPRFTRRTRMLLAVCGPATLASRWASTALALGNTDSRLVAAAVIPMAVAVGVTIACRLGWKEAMS